MGANRRQGPGRAVPGRRSQGGHLGARWASSDARGRPPRVDGQLRRAASVRRQQCSGQALPHAGAAGHLRAQQLEASEPGRVRPAQRRAHPARGQQGLPSWGRTRGRLSSQRGWCGTSTSKPGSAGASTPSPALWARRWPPAAASTSFLSAPARAASSSPHPATFTLSLSAHDVARL